MKYIQILKTSSWVIRILVWLLHKMSSTGCHSGVCFSKADTEDKVEAGKTPSSFRTRLLLAAQQKVKFQEKLAMGKFQKDTSLSQTSQPSTDEKVREVGLMDSEVKHFQRADGSLSEELREKILEAVAKYSSKNGSETEFNFSGYGLGYEGIASLFLTLLFDSPKLSKLNFSDCNLDARGISVVYRILETNSDIRELNLSRNNLGQCGIDWVIKMLQFCELQVLALADNGLSDKDMENLIEVLPEAGVLKELDLSHNLLGLMSGIVLTRHLPGNHSLRHLNLSHNELGAEGLRRIKEGLRENDTLERLDVSWNSLQDHGMVHVSEILLKAVSLKEIALNGNFITAVGARHLAQSLRENSSLEVLEMGQNFLRNDGACALVRSVRSNGSSKLRLLDLNGTLVEKEFATIYRRIQLDNTTFHVTGFCVVGGDDGAIPCRRNNSKLKFEYK